MTEYSILTEDGANILKAKVENGGSGLGKEAPIDLNQTPFLNITWKVEKGLPGIDEKSKKGHDFAARFFVVKKTGITPLSNKAINYVFSSNFINTEKKEVFLYTERWFHNHFFNMGFHFYSGFFAFHDKQLNIL